MVTDDAMPTAGRIDHQGTSLMHTVMLRLCASQYEHMLIVRMTVQGDYSAGLITQQRRCRAVLPVAI